MRGQRIRWAAAGAIAAAAAIGGGAFAATHVIADGTPIHACAQKENGQLRLSADGGCRPSETALSWSSGGATSLEALEGTPCALGGRPGTTYVAETNGVDRFDLTRQCLMPDGSEPNETRETAAAMPPSGSVTFRTIYPAGDDDWFAVSRQSLATVFVGTQIGIAAPDAPFAAQLYRDGVLVKTATPNGDGSWTLHWSRYADDPTDTAAHDWVLHVTSPDVQLYLLQVW